MLRKGDIRDTIVKIVFVLIGICMGFTFFYILRAYPERRGMVVIFLVFIALLAILITEKIRYRIKYEYKVAKIAEEIRHASISAEMLAWEEEEDNCAKQLYAAVNDSKRKSKRKIEIQHVVIDLINTLAVNIELDSLIDVVLSRLVEETVSNWGVFYIYNVHSDKLELKKSLGLSKNIYKEFDIEMGEGFIGMTASAHKIKVYKDIPKNTVFENKTFLGKIQPKNIMAVPVLSENELKAVIAFGSMYDYSEEQIEIISVLKNYLGYALNNCITYERTQRMAKELQFQNQLIQNMNDELEKKVIDRTDFLNSIINSIEDYAIISVDKDGYITTWNKGAENIRGFKSEKVIGHHITNLYDESEAEKERTWRYYETARKEGHFSSYGWQFKNDGARYFADTIITPIYDKNEDLQGYTNITKDITENKNLEQKLFAEMAYNETLVESSTRALIYTDKNGLIISSNKLSRGILAPEGTELSGKGIYEFFVGGEFVEKNIKRVASTSGKGEFVDELLYKHEGTDRVKLSVSAVGDEETESAGVLIHITTVANASAENRRNSV